MLPSWHFWRISLLNLQIMENKQLCELVFLLPCILSTLAAAASMYVMWAVSSQEIIEDVDADNH